MSRAVEETRGVNEHDQNDQTQPKRRKLHQAHLANDVSDSSRGQSTTIVSPDDSSHHAEQARVIIQSELEGNDGMNSERQSILRSALGLVNTLANGRNPSFDDGPLLEVPEGDGYEDMTQSLAPTPELLYMLLRGNSPRELAYSIDINGTQVRKPPAALVIVYSGRTTSQKRHSRKWQRPFSVARPRASSSINIVSAFTSRVYTMRIKCRGSSEIHTLPSKL